MRQAGVGLSRVGSVVGVKALLLVLPNNTDCAGVAYVTGSGCGKTNWPWYGWYSWLLALIICVASRQCLSLQNWTATYCKLEDWSGYSKTTGCKAPLWPW